MPVTPPWRLEQKAGSVLVTRSQVRTGSATTTASARKPPRGVCRIPSIRAATDDRQS
jgi:hypothetical protein